MPDRIDDPTINGSEVLWRAVHPTQLTRDESSGNWRPTSGAFRDSDSEMSVDLASLTDLNSFRARNPARSVARFRVSVVRAMGKIVVRDPIEGNPAHALVCPKLTAGQARSISTLEDIWAFLIPPSDLPS